MTRIAVTADLHADDFGQRIDPESGLNARWVDTLAMVRWVAEDAARRACDVLVVAGDFTEQRHPAPWRVAMIGEALGAFGGPTVLAKGNHDGSRGGRSIVEVLAGGRDLWRGFSQPGWCAWNHLNGLVDGDVADGSALAIAVMPHLDAHWLRTQPGYENAPDAEVLEALAAQYLVVAAGLRAEITERDPDLPAILVVHQALSGGLMSDTQQAFLGDRQLVVDTRALAAQGWDAVLAGHFHRHQVLSIDPLVAYAGAPYRTDFGEEHQAKGYLVVDVEHKGHVSMEFVGTPARRFVTVDALDGGINGPCENAVVRVVNLPADEDPADWRRLLEAAGAWEVQEIRRRPAAEESESISILAEGLTTTAALQEYFAGDPDRDALVELGRGILAEVGS